jgi:hypothetical protein
MVAEEDTLSDEAAAALQDLPGYFENLGNQQTAPPEQAGQT